MDYLIDGIAWYALQRAAEIIGTTPAKVKQMMGAGLLEWRPARAGSIKFLVRRDQVVRLALERKAADRAASRAAAAKPRAKRHSKAVPHDIVPTAPPLVIDPFNFRAREQTVLPWTTDRPGFVRAGPFPEDSDVTE
ncbi:hypothetical protein [Sphingomonas sp.]|uniref:hypothetical protein n=1 Tax=Sphingomonas sp. TaxID=28214 RepID=UPI002DD658B3|nr:hypothetical protein [Sphingomonas sp.]